MKNVLIVSPHFPPINAPDMQRVRTSLPHFKSFGWQPHVLAVSAECQPGVVEPRLTRTLPPDVPVTYTSALPLRVTRHLGVGNVALRAFPHLYRAGGRLIPEEGIDLVYFSTTMFAAMALGPLWKRRFGVPFVIDMQDPWVSDPGAPAHRLPKHRQARALHARLEPFTMRQVSGVVTVSAAYTETLRRRYPTIPEGMCLTVPFGACEEDFEEARRDAWENPFFQPHDGHLHGVYAGAVSGPMRVAARILFRALEKARARRLEGNDVRLTFVGTSYATGGSSPKVVESEAEAAGLARGIVQEHPDRIPYFDALRLLLDSQFLVMLGSADSAYTPSKLFQHLLAGRPIVAVLHEQSPVLDVFLKTQAGVATTFRDAGDIEESAARLAGPLAALLDRLPFEPATDWSIVAQFTARELTRRQCGLFDAVLAARPAA